MVDIPVKAVAMFFTAGLRVLAVTGASTALGTVFVFQHPKLATSGVISAEVLVFALTMLGSAGLGSAQLLGRFA
jgi:hypothetical protein